jgi:hypothetical protein
MESWTSLQTRYLGRANRPRLQSRLSFIDYIWWRSRVSRLSTMPMGGSRSESPEDDAEGRTPLVLGGRLLGEEDRARRIVAAAVMVAGIVLLSVG